MAYCVFQSDNLRKAWRDSPFDHLSWVALIIWFLPWAYLVLSRRPEFRLGNPEHGLLGGALLLSLLGTMASMNALKYIALAMAVVGAVRWRPIHFLWFAAAASWMPALGYILSRLITAQAPTNIQLILATRLLIAVVAVLFVWLSHRQKNPNPSQS